MKSILLFAVALLMCGSLAAQQDTTRKPPPDFVEVDKPPEIISKAEPAYPPIALKAGKMGVVWTKIWIDSLGKVRDVLILKSEDEIFNRPSIDAAWKFKFTPAYIGKRPVDVWVSVPFRYAIAEKVDSLKKAMSASGELEKKTLATISALLEGTPLTWDEVKAIIAPRATAISGGQLKPLVEVINEQLGGKFSLEDAGRKIVFSTSEDKGERGVHYYVFRTEPAGKKGSPHFHTVVIRPSADGTPQVIHWQTWQASR